MTRMLFQAKVKLKYSLNRIHLFMFIFTFYHVLNVVVLVVNIQN